MRRGLLVAFAAVVLVLCLAAAEGVLPSVYQTQVITNVCGAYLLPNGDCVRLPTPGDPGATCEPTSDGGCSWVWKSPYPTR